MPIKFRKNYPKTTAKRKSYSKKRKSYSSSTPTATGGIGAITSTTQKGYLPFGRQYKARLPYVETNFISCNDLTQLTDVGSTYRANSVFDPRFEVGGHQPLQYDILQAIYERCWVQGCKVELTFSNPSADGMYCGYRVRGATNPVTTTGKTIEYLGEMRDSVYKPINNTGNQTCKFNFYVPCAKMLGLTNAQYADIQYSESMIAAVFPAVLIEPFALTTSGTGVSDTIRYVIKMTYHVTFTNPITAPQS